MVGVGEDEKEDIELKGDLGEGFNSGYYERLRLGEGMIAE